MCVRARPRALQHSHTHTSTRIHPPTHPPTHPRTTAQVEAMTRKTVGVSCCPTVHKLPMEEKSTANELVGAHEDLA